MGQPEIEPAAHRARSHVADSGDDLRVIIDTIPILAWAARPDGTAEFFNQRWLDYTGLSQQEAEGTGWTVAVHPDDLSALSDRWTEIIASRQHGEAEARLRRSDGQYRWFLFRAAPLADKQGEVVKWYGTNTDIDDYKGAEHALRASEQSLRMILNTVPGLVSTMAASGELELVSDQVVAFFGKTREELQDWLPYVHPDDRERLMSKWARSLETGEPFEDVQRLLRADGQYRWFHSRSHPFRDREGRIVRWYNLLIDIDERKTAEDALRRSNAYLEHAQELTHTGSVGLRVSDAQIFWSPETARIYGYDPAIPPTAGMVLERVHPDDVQLVQEVLARAAKGGAFFDFEHRLLMPDGSIKHIRNMARSVQDEFGNEEVLGAVADVTEQHNARRTLEQALARAQASEAELRRSESILAEGEAISLTGSGSWNLKTNQMVWSAQNCRMLGLDPATTDASVELFLQRVHPDEVAQLAPIIERETAARRPYELRYRVVMPDGAIKHFHTLMRPIVKPSGEIDEYIGVSRDVTKAKLAEEAVRRSEQLARGQVEALVQSLDVLATSPAPEQLIAQMLGTVGQLLNGEWVALWLLDGTRESLVLHASVKGLNAEPAGFDHPFVKDPQLWKSDALLSELFVTGMPVSCENMETDPRVLPELRDFFRPHGMKKFLRLPTLVGGEVKGFITICHAEAGPYRAAEIELAQALAHQAMLAIQTGQAATLEERNRMARDIHDTLAQGFTAVIIQLQAAEDAKSRGLHDELGQHLQSARELARYSLNEARRSVRALRPQALEDAPFWEALKAMIKNTTARTALQTSFRIIGATRDIPPVDQEHLLHIGQEALTNTLKYAHASRFETRLSFSPDELRLEFNDDGRGFTTTDGHEGYGLLGMRERAAKIGATLDVTSVAGRGTKIVVVCPATGSA
jgi:PAS domain S-box-containing protein